jgi:chromosome partitioning protein
MRTIAVMNQKGGCGKTTIAINLASAFTQLDRRVLLIDIDPQAHASVGLKVETDHLEKTAYELLMDPAVLINDALIRKTDNLSLLPASTALSAVEQELADRDGRERRLAYKLSKLPPDAFDVVIIDCPPNVGLLTFNALIAAGEVLIPVDASFFSLHGLIKLRETIEVIEEELDHKLQARVVCNNLDTRTHFSNELLEEINKFHGAILTGTYISNTVRLKETAAKGVSIFELDRSSKAAGQFLSLARELAEKYVKVERNELNLWIEKLYGPQTVSEGVLFTLEAPEATEVLVTGEFTNWSREGIPLERDAADGIWKTIADIEPGEYEYRFVVDGVWIRDPNNKDYIRNEFGQENSLLVV